MFLCAIIIAMGLALYIFVGYLWALSLGEISNRKDDKIP